MMIQLLTSGRLILEHMHIANTFYTSLKFLLILPNKNSKGYNVNVSTKKLCYKIMNLLLVLGQTTGHIPGECFTVHALINHRSVLLSLDE